MKIRFIFSLLLLLLPIVIFSQEFSPILENIEKSTYTFASRDSVDLKMDVYRLKNDENIQPCMLFVFGGGFMAGKRDEPFYNTYFSSLAEQGITVISIDYRLGLLGAPRVGVFKTKPLEDAIQIAVEDLYAATNYVLIFAEKLKIDRNKIMASGSSAGAITVLHADHIKQNGLKGSEVLPKDFQYAGILSFSGAIFSRKGIPSYKTEPAPTLFFHGDRDRLVFYNKLRLFNKGFFGSKSLAKKFKKEGYNYCFYTIEDMGHSIASTPMVKYNEQINRFIQEYIFDEQPWQMDIQFKDKSLQPEKKTKIKDLYE